eukprot:TRINITY_DN2096_c0_g1_i1.p1 TRINITY_DN2096_c0_g1~~TRINITY_DN2096_c0_g1_i1.p1  ORF type:complete len:1430 (-),score=323.34 TRINITY_DN2096_c0_g1_i1:230-4081(-)
MEQQQQTLQPMDTQQGSFPSFPNRRRPTVLNTSSMAPPIAFPAPSPSISSASAPLPSSTVPTTATMVSSITPPTSTQSNISSNPLSMGPATNTTSMPPISTPISAPKTTAPSFPSSPMDTFSKMSNMPIASDASRSPYSSGAFFESAMAALKVSSGHPELVPVTPPALYDTASLNYSQAASSAGTGSQVGYATNQLGEAQLMPLESMSADSPLKSTSPFFGNGSSSIAPLPPQISNSPLETLDSLLRLRMSRKDLDWCGEFQVASDAFQIARDWNEYEGEKGMILANAAGDLSQLAQDFVSAARTYGTVILNEYCLPLEAKTIKPVSVGGIAGGDKYLVPTCNILFKLATDKHGLYGGLENAQKAANHELRSLIAIYNCGVPGLHVPLMAIISHRGLRLIAETLVPVRGMETIKYGSADQGRTVHADAAELNKKIEELGRLLNLKPYYFKGKLMHLCTDIEAHQGIDGRFYLLDFARVIPPCYPTRIQKVVTETGEQYLSAEEANALSRSTHMYHQFRPSFIRAYSMPLCSEGLSRMQEPGDVALHSDELKRATSYLHEIVVPRFVRELEALSETTAMQYPKSFDLTGRLHRIGVNVRLLGIAYQICQTTAWKNVLLYEMISRATKNISRNKMRELMESQSRLSDVGARTTMASILTKLLFDFKQARSVMGESRGQYQKEVDSAVEFWENEIPEYLSKHFPLLRNGSLIDGERKYWAQICRDTLHDVDRNRLFSRVVQMLDLALTKPGVERRFKQMEYTVPFHATEIEDVPAQISHMDLVTQASGVMLLAQGLQMRGPAAITTLKMAIDKLEEACPYFQYGHSALFDVANAYYAVGIRENPQQATSYLKAAKEKFVEALDLHPTRLTYQEAVRASKRASDFTNWQPIGTLKGHEGAVECVSVLKDGRVLSAGRDGTLRTWDAKKSRMLSAWRADDAPVWSMQYIRCATGFLVVSSSGSTERGYGEVRAWRLAAMPRAEETQTERDRKQAGRDDEDEENESNRDQGETDDPLSVEESKARLLLRIRVDGCGVCRALCHMEEDDMALGDDAGRISLLHGHRTTVVRAWAAHTAPITALAYDADRHMLLSTSRDHRMHVWDLRIDGRPALTLDMREPIHRVRLLPSSSSSSNSSALGSSSTPISTPATSLSSASASASTSSSPISGPIGASAFAGASSASCDALLALNSGDIAWIDVRRPCERRRLGGHLAAATDLCVVPRRRLVASVSADHHLRLIDPDDHRCMRVSLLHTDAVTAVDWHPQLSCLVSASRDRTIRLFGDPSSLA